MEDDITKTPKMQVIRKAPLDNLVRAVGKYWETGDVDYLEAINSWGEKAMSEASAWARFGSGMCLSDLVHACHKLMTPVGTTKSAVTNEDIYIILNLLGFEVRDGI